MINWQAELRPGSSPEPHRHGRLWGEHQKPFITRLKRARVFGPIFGNIWFHETICCKVEKETAKKKRKVHLWNPKMPPLNELCRFGLCNLILATRPDKEKKKKKKKKGITVKMRVSGPWTATKHTNKRLLCPRPPLHVSVSNYTLGLNCQKMANGCSATECTEHKTG